MKIFIFALKVECKIGIDELMEVVVDQNFDEAKKKVFGKWGDRQELADEVEAFKSMSGAGTERRVLDEARKVTAELSVTERNLNEAGIIYTNDRLGM